MDPDALAAAEKKKKNKAKKEKQKQKKKAAAAAAGGGDVIYGAATGVANARPADADDKERQLKELLPQLTSDELQLLLHDSRYNVQAAVDQHAQGNLDEWSTSGSPKKQGASGGGGDDAEEAKAAAPAPAPAPVKSKPKPKGPTATLFLEVKNLPFKLNKGDFSAEFSTATAIVHPDRGEAVCTFDSTELAQAAYDESNKKAFDGRTMRVTFVASAPQPPPKVEKPKRQAPAAAAPKPSGPAVRARETQDLQAQGFSVSSSGMKTFDVSQLKAMSHSQSGAISMGAPASAPSPFSNTPASAPVNNNAPDAAGVALLNQMQVNAQGAWSQAFDEAGMNFAVLRSQLAAREQEMKMSLWNKQREEAAFLQEQRAKLQQIANSPADLEQFMKVLKKDKPSWASPRYQADRAAIAAIMATGTILERALPTISAREKRGGGGGAKAASSVQIRPIGSKAKEIKAAKKAGGGKGSGKQEGGKGNGRQQGGKGSGKQQGGKGSGKQQGGKGGNGKGSGNFVEKKSGIVHIKTAAQKSKDSKAAHADAPATAGDSAESGAKPQREKKERRARGTGKKQQDM